MTDVEDRKTLRVSSRTVRCKDIGTSDLTDWLVAPVRTYMCKALTNAENLIAKVTTECWGLVRLSDD